MEEKISEEILTESVAEQSETEKLQSELAALNDKYLRVAAELENTRRRASLDAQNLARSRATGVAENFLPLIDAIETAVSHSPDNTDFAAMKSAADGVLDKIGVRRMETAGQILDPKLHNAIQVVDMPKSEEPCAARPLPNTIVGELQSGYTMGEVVLRPAMVVVGK
ncbi:MAG: nucleotide exchange factor GrpE [Rickettsiales bacterium]|nr:nucleotide exchange factor GrpE [Rickettsiales bacterium]